MELLSRTILRILNFQNTLFVDCGNNDITNKMQGNANMKHDYKNNAYWYNNAEGKDKYDTTATFSDPQMKIRRKATLL